MNAFGGIPHLVCYSAKANSNLALIRLFTNLGGGVDVVSGGELYRALKAGADPQKIVFSGVGKRGGRDRIRFEGRYSYVQCRIFHGASADQ